MIQKISEHQRIKEITANLDAHLEYDDMAPRVNDSASSVNIDLTEDHDASIHLTQDKIMTKDREPKPYYIKDYLNEEKRKTLLISTSKEKKKAFKEKRQKFEKHRRDL